MLNIVLLVLVMRGETMWPEAESNCRPLVFQTMDNLVTFHNCNLLVVNYRSFVRGENKPSYDTQAKLVELQNEFQDELTDA